MNLVCITSREGWKSELQESWPMTHFLQLTNLVGICSSAELPWCLASLGNECLLDGVALCMNRMSEFASVSDDLLHIYLQRMIRGVLLLCRYEWKWNIFPLSSCEKRTGYVSGARQIYFNKAHNNSETHWLAQCDQSNLLSMKQPVQRPNGFQSWFPVSPSFQIVLYWFCVCIHLCCVHLFGPNRTGNLFQWYWQQREASRWL